MTTEDKALADARAEIERLKLHHQTTADAARHTIRVLKEENERLKADNDAVYEDLERNTKVLTDHRIACKDKDSRISSLEADCALLGAEVADARHFTDHNAANKNTLRGQVSYEVSRYRVTRQIADASPTASAWVKGTKL